MQHIRVSKHTLPFQSLYKGSGKQCRLVWFASNLYPRGPEFIYETTDGSGFCFACRHGTGTQSHAHASRGVHLSTNTNNTAGLMHL